MNRMQRAQNNIVRYDLRNFFHRLGDLDPWPDDEAYFSTRGSDTEVVLILYSDDPVTWILMPTGALDIDVTRWASSPVAE